MDHIGRRTVLYFAAVMSVLYVHGCPRVRYHPPPRSRWWLDSGLGLCFVPDWAGATVASVNHKRDWDRPQLCFPLLMLAERFLCCYDVLVLGKQLTHGTLAAASAARPVPFQLHLKAMGPTVGTLSGENCPSPLLGFKLLGILLFHSPRGFQVWAGAKERDPLVKEGFTNCECDNCVGEI